MAGYIEKLTRKKPIFKLLSKIKDKGILKWLQKFKFNYSIEFDKLNYTFLGNVYDQDLLSRMIYKNEKWDIVVHRFHDRFLKYYNFPITTKDNECRDDKFKIITNNLYFDTNNLKDDWLYFYDDNQSLQNYSLKFNALFNSEFREIQFGFRYLDFYNRYRFRVEEGRLNFDIVHKGQFYNGLLSVPFSFTKNKEFDVEIVILNNRYQFLVNGEIIMGINDKLKLFPNGSVALILWDDCGKSNIKGEFKNIQLNYIR